MSFCLKISYFMVIIESLTLNLLLIVMNLTLNLNEFKAHHRYLFTVVGIPHIFVLGKTKYKS